MITFQDIFQSSFLERMDSITLLDMSIAFVLAFLLGLFIFWVYKKSYSGVMYSSSFGLTLIALTMITTTLILAISTNIVLSLGMVGALSIVRFRTAIKEPLDIAFLFWSISTGIILAAGLIPLAVFSALFIGIIMIVFSNRKSVDNPYILMVVGNTEIEEAIHQIIVENVTKVNLKSKSITKNILELNYEVRLKNNSSDFLNKLDQLEGVDNTLLVSYNGDYMG